MWREPNGMHALGSGDYIKKMFDRANNKDSTCRWFSIRNVMPYNDDSQTIGWESLLSNYTINSILFWLPSDVILIVVMRA